MSIIHKKFGRNILRQWHPVGKKKFELRLNDFSVKEGDVLALEEWDPKTQKYTGRKIEKKVTYVLRFGIDELVKFWPEEKIKEKKRACK